MSRICVAVRKRPCGEGDKDIVQAASPQCIVNEPKVKYDLTPYTERHTFYYDEVIGETTGNREVYNRCCKALIDTIFSNGNAACFAYGQTGSGKTHTMLGRDSEPGLYMCAARDVFQRAGKQNCDVYASFYEIYGRKLFDLLNDRAKLVAREDAEKVINICGLTEHLVSNTEGMFDIISKGSSYRAAGATSANAESSRSHAVLQMEVRDKATRKTIGRISFIDLAGNERGADTFDCDRRTRMEGAEINKSLLALKECIRALGMGKSHVPFRGSILTEVLRDSFLGNSRTTMIATISPTATHCENTLNTLRYTQRVKDLGGRGEGGREQIPMEKESGRVAGNAKDAGGANNNKGGANANAGAGAGAKPEPKAGRRMQPRPEWMEDFVSEEGSGGNADWPQLKLAPHPKDVVPNRRRTDDPTPPNGRPSPQSQSGNGAPGSNTKARPAGLRANNVVLKDPKLQTIVQNHINEMDEDELEGDEESDDDSAVTAPPGAVPSSDRAPVTPPSAALQKGGGGGGQQAQQPDSARQPSVSPTLGRNEVKQVRAVHAHVVREITKAEDEIMALHRRHVDVKMAGIKEEIKAVQALDDKDTVDEYVVKVSAILQKQKKDIDGILGELSRLQGMLKDEEELSRTLTPHVKKGKR